MPLFYGGEMYDIPKAIESFFECIKIGFNFATENKKRQSETDIIKSKKKLIKKSDKQEDLILDMACILRKYLNTFDTKDKMRTKCLLRQIKKVN